MSANPNFQHDRQLCQVGDFVLASSVPEWKTDGVLQTYTPPNAVSAGLFGAPLITPKKWTFRGSFYIDPAGDPITIWRREE